MDLNGDEKRDLVAANFVGSISVMLGNGDGTFQGHLDYAVGSGARGVVAADLNDDGILDLVTANQTSNTVSILRGNGNGTFQSHVDYSVSGGPFSLVAADFNGDGQLDLAVVSQSANILSVLLGRGDGTFLGVFGCGCTVGRLPFGIGTGDFNRDGLVDLAVANYSDNTVSVYLGNGGGTFNQSATIPTAPQPEFVTSADLNGDGFLDLIVGTNQVTAPRISVFLGRGDGTFQPHVDYAAGVKPRSVIAADLNGDGELDLAVANYGSSNVSVLLGNGNGTFQPQFTLGVTGLSPQSIIAGDFNGDGRLDLAPANFGNNTVSVLMQSLVLTHSTSSLDFGNQPVGTTSPPQIVTVSNSGTAPLTINSIFATGDYGETNTCTTPVMPGKSCTVSVAFTPVEIGTRLGRISITANTATTPPTINLTGTGSAATTTTTVSSSLNPSVYGQSVSFTAKVIPSIAGTPTGTITFYDGVAVLGTKTVSIAGIAVLTTSSLAGGSHSVTASYNGNSLFARSTSSAVTQAVTQAKAIVGVSSSLNPSYVGQTVTLRTNVSGQYGGVPSGSVTFKQGTTILATVALVGGQATYMHVFVKAGTFAVTAVYGGDVNFILKTSTALKQVVNRYTTNTVLQSTPNPSTFGQAVTFTATVTSTGPQPTGIVAFKDGTTSTTIGTASLVAGVATLRKSNLAVGTHSITATYNGNTASSKSTSPVLTQVVK